MPKQPLTRFLTVQVREKDQHVQDLSYRLGAAGYLATCPELPPMTAFGETLSEARSNAAEEIAAWLDAHSASFDVTAEQWARRFV